MITTAFSTVFDPDGNFYFILVLNIINREEQEAGSFDFCLMND